MAHPTLEDAPQSPPVPAPPAAVPWSNPTVVPILAVGLALAGVMMAAAVVGAWVTDLRSAPEPPQPTAVPAAGSIDGRTTAAFDVATAARSVIVRSADLGGSLYRVSGATVEQSADVVQATSDGSDTMTVELNYHITWRVRFSDGALSETLDLRNVPLSGIEIAGGAGRLDLTLGPARGRVPINASGRIDEFAIHVSEDTPVRVRAGAGADRLTLDGVTRTRVAAGSRFTSDGWDAATDRYDIDATAHVNTLTVDRR